VTRRAALAVAIVAVLAAGVLAVLVGDDGTAPGPEQARFRVEGAASVTASDGTTRTIADATEVVDFGDQLVMEAGTGVLELAGGASYELRHRDGAGTALEVGVTPRVTAGDVLVVGGFPAPVAVDTATLTAQGALRVDADELVAGAYAGRARVTGVGDIGEVQGLRRLVLVAGATPEPVTFDGSDEWDRRFLGEAIAFGDRLEALARGYTSDLAPEQGRSPEFFQSVLPALAEERELSEDLLDPSRSPGETLVGAAIVVQGRRGTFRERWEAVFAFRAAGAAWGLVALDQGVSSAPVLDTIELAIDASGGTVASAPTTTSPRPRPTVPTTTSPGAPPTTGTTTTTTAPPPPPPSGGLLDPVIDPTSQVLGDLLDVLGLGDD
jgi:hypothetical protein